LKKKKSDTSIVEVNNAGGNPNQFDDLKVIRNQRKNTSLQLVINILIVDAKVYNITVL
jgi:hypothetical protein